MAALGTRLSIDRDGEPLPVAERLGPFGAAWRTGVARLVGQSGMSKTRLVRALFDARIRGPRRSRPRWPSMATPAKPIRSYAFDGRAAASGS